MLTLDEIRRLNQRRWGKFYKQVACYLFFVPLIYIALSVYNADISWGMPALEAFSILFVVSFPITVPALAYCFIYPVRLFRDVDASSLDRYILYLRPFHDDDNTVDKSEIGDSFKNHFPLMFLFSRGSPNFDLFLSRAFKHTRFSTISLGNPRDVLPKPGTQKLYPDDNAWKTCVSSLMNSAELVFFRCADTENFKWELDYLVGHDVLKRSLMYIGLETYELHMWNKRSAIMRESGIVIPEKFPGFGVTVGFTDANRAFILSKSLSDPATFRDSVLQRMRLKEHDLGHRKGRVERG
jgi:hypothetical protein